MAAVGVAFGEPEETLKAAGQLKELNSVQLALGFNILTRLLSNALYSELHALLRIVCPHCFIGRLQSQSGDLEDNAKVGGEQLSS